MQPFHELTTSMWRTLKKYEANEGCGSRSKESRTFFVVFGKIWEDTMNPSGGHKNEISQCESCANH